jgi:hypothetical protein
MNASLCARRHDAAPQQLLLATDAALMRKTQVQAL